MSDIMKKYRRQESSQPRSLGVNSNGNGNGNEIITYVPQPQAPNDLRYGFGSAGRRGVGDGDRDRGRSGVGGSSSDYGEGREMGRVRRAVYVYTHKLGQEFTLVLLFSLAYQVVVAAFVGIRAIHTTPLINWLPDSANAGGGVGVGGGGGIAGPATGVGSGGDGSGGAVSVWSIVGYGASLIAGFFVQALLVAELAQVVWLNRTDRLKIRLQRDSLWWWVHLAVLLLIATLDFVLVGLAVTGTSDLGRAWARSQASQLVFVTTAIFVILNVMTLLRCASVMRTSTSEENRREVENRLAALADEILLDAGEETREQAQAVWQQLSADPRKFLPLSDAVLGLVRRQHPDFFPPGLGGDSWGYDLTSHTFSALPPDVHLALTQGRGRAESFTDDDQRQLWSLGPHDLADVIGFNIENQGRPRFVDLSDPTEPHYVYNPANLQALVVPEPATQLKPGLINGGRVGGGNELNTASSQPSVPDPATTPFADKESFVMALSDLERVLFGGYLQKEFARLKGGGEAWVEGVGADIWGVYNLVELQYLYGHWLSTRSRQ